MKTKKILFTLPIPATYLLIAFCLWQTDVELWGREVRIFSIVIAAFFYYALFAIADIQDWFKN